MDADLYIDSIDAGRYWPHNTGTSFEEALAEIKAGHARLEDYPFLSRRQAEAFKLVIDAKQYLPAVPMMTVPQPAEAEVIPLNCPDENSFVIVTGNNRHTIDVLTSLWSQGSTPAYLVVVDCLGHTVDMAVVFGDFLPERLKQALTDSHLNEQVAHHHLIVPGLTSPLAGSFRETTGWEIEIGPVCAVELPLALGDRWTF